MEFYDYLFLLEQLLSNMISQNSIFLLVTGDFNARNSSWWKNDCVTSEGNKIESLTCPNMLSQLSSDPAHISKALLHVFDSYYLIHSHIIIILDFYKSAKFRN